MFGTERILPLWPSLIRSPVLTQFAWSPLVEEGVQKNMHFLLPPRNTPIPPNFPLLPANDQYAPIPGLLALHIRRGDYAEHCRGFITYGSTWMGFNTFPSFQDRFPPSSEEWAGLNATALYFKHCFPTIEQIVEKVMDVKKTSIGKDLRNVYILTNGAREWVAELKDALRQAAKWDKVTSSRDILLNKEQKYIAQAIDMMIAHKAQVFIGNGVRFVALFLICRIDAIRCECSSHP